MTIYTFLNFRNFCKYLPSKCKYDKPSGRRFIFILSTKTKEETKLVTKEKNECCLTLNKTHAESCACWSNFQRQKIRDNKIKVGALSEQEYLVN